MVMGTAHYIAPEQALGQAAEPASDVYSLAVCGYECLAGYRPFRSENAVTVAMMHIRDMPPPLPADVAAGVRALIEATLIKDPRQRYRNGGEFAAAVTAVRHGQPLPAPAALHAPPGPQAQQHPIPQPPHQPGTAQVAQPHYGSYPTMQAVPPQAAPPSGPISPQYPTQPPRQRRNTGLWVTLTVLIVLLVVAGVVLPILFDSSSAGNPDSNDSGGADFGVTDTAHPTSNSDTALPSEQQSGLPLAPSTSAALTSGGPASGSHAHGATTIRGSHTSSWMARPVAVNSSTRW